MEDSMSTTIRQKIVTSAGVSEKVITEDFSDPKFAVYQGSVTPGKFSTIEDVTTNVAGISSQAANKSKEGIGTGGYDKHFNVY
jgi:hypothetical protein